MASEGWKQQTLDAHNMKRAVHGAPPLQWSDECYESALAQARKCEAQNTLSHGNDEGPSGPHGQNAYMSYPAGSAGDAVESWYGELHDPGYDFSNSGFHGGTGHFTQVVWKSTTHVGMAASPNGTFVVANYFPAGNFMGEFPNNVFPADGEAPACSPSAPVSSEPQTVYGDGGTQTVTSSQLTPELEAKLEGCPFSEYREAVEQAISVGGTVTVERTANSIKIITEVGGCTSEMSGSWS